MSRDQHGILFNYYRGILFDYYLHAGNVFETIRTRIYEIRGKKVMLDRDLAELYHVETKQLKRQVKRNLTRFPEDFMFELTYEENDALRCQIGTLKRGEHSKYLPYAFTELGIAMLSTVLSSELAIQMNINIMRAFVLMRQALSELSETNLRVEQLSRRVDNLNHYVDDILRDQNDINEATALQIDLIQDSLAELHAEKTEREEENSHRRIGFRVERNET